MPSALAFEFSHGRDLVVCNCGPAPSDEEESALLFRQGIAHSAPTINALSAAAIPTARAARRTASSRSAAPPEMATEEADHSLVMRTHGYDDRFGVVLERRLTLLADGNSLVGQERMLKDARPHLGRLRHPLPPRRTRRRCRPATTW